MTSISKKILRSALCWLIIIVVLMSAVAVIVVTRISTADSEGLMLQACEKETLRFNSEFTLLENSATIIAKYLEEQEEGCASEEEMLSDEFCRKIQEMTISIANRTGGAMAVYFRYNPELTGNGTQGFLWSRKNDNEKFAYCEPTDILQYDQDDAEHVGWFYKPKKNHEAMWISPYYNQNLNVFMISYVIPYYTHWGDFLGVIGMDIDFNKIVRMTGEVNLYQTGSASLIDLSEYYIYSTDENGNARSDNLSLDLYNHITTINRDSDILEMTMDGVNSLTCVGRLSNGMRIMLSVPVREINAHRNNMLFTFAGIMAASLLITAFFMIRFTNKIVYPLKVLTRITGKYAEGDWEETYISETGDEIQQLSESVSVMAQMTRSYIEKIHENAMTDALTGLKNKNCYLSYIKNFQNQGKDAWEYPRYAVAVFDINYLKKVNDQFGHEAGDLLIQQAGQYICHVFAHSPVFRIGGDEYVALLKTSDYAIRKELGEKFVQGMKDLPPAAEKIPFSVSIGMADFPEDGADYDEVFSRADERMYEFKKKMKAERE